jgi:multiple sugar transport system permease protein
MSSDASIVPRIGGTVRAEALTAGKRRARLTEALIGLAFVAPVAIIAILFELFPVLYGFFLSMQDGVNVPEGFVGLDHFLQAVGSFAYMIGIAVAVIFVISGRQMWRGAMELQNEGHGRFRPFLLPAFIVAPSFMLMAFLLLNGLAAYAIIPFGLLLIGAAIYQVLQSQQNLPPTVSQRYLLNSFAVALLTLSAVFLIWFLFSELHRRSAPFLDILTQVLLTRGTRALRFAYVEPLYSQLVALLGAAAAFGAILAIGPVRAQLDPDARPRARGWLGLLRSLLIAVVIGFCLYILGAQELLRLTLVEFAQVPVPDLRQFTRFRLERILNTVTEWQQIFASLVGAVAIVMAWLVWQDSRKRETTLGTTTMLFMAVCLLAGGWLFVGELPLALAKGDPQFYQSLIRTVIYAALTVPIQLAIGLGLAYLLYYEISWGKSVYRLIYFIPYIAPTVATATVFAMIFSADARTGQLNLFMQALGLPAQEWLRNPRGVFQLIAEFLGGPGTRLPEFLHGPALPLLAAIIYGIWVFSGYNAVVFMAGFGNVPKDIYEAAAVDGAGRWETFRKVIFPLISPTTFFLSLLAIIGTFRAFTHIWVLRLDDRGGMDTTVVYIYETILQASEIKTRPYAAAMSFLLFGIILILTIVQNRLSKDRVFYG